MKSNLIKKSLCLLIGILLFALIYMIYGHYIGKMTKEIMISAFESYEKVENNPYSDIISDEYYNHMVHRAYCDFSLSGANYKYRITHPFVIHWFVGANIWIDYSDEFTVNNQLISGSRDATVKFSLELKNKHWKIVDVCESP